MKYSYAQTYTVSSLITEITNKTVLPDVNVFIDSTSIGTVSELEGKYTFDAFNSNLTIAFSYIGYQTEKIPINGQNTINISLIEDTVSLNELVVDRTQKNLI